MYDINELKGLMPEKKATVKKSDERDKLLEQYATKCYTVHELCKAIANDNFKVSLNTATLKAVFGEVQGKRYSAYFSDEIKALQLLLIAYQLDKSKEKKSVIIKSILSIFKTFGLPAENIPKISASKLNEISTRATRYARGKNGTKLVLLPCFQFLMVMISALTVNVNYAHFVGVELAKLTKTHDKHIDEYTEMFIAEQTEQAEQAEQAENN